MLRYVLVLISICLGSCKSLPDSRPTSAQFMQLATVQKSTQLPLDPDGVYSGIALVDSDQSCTGVFIGRETLPQSPAYLLTAGHCLIDFDEISSSNRIFRDAAPRSDRNSIRFPGKTDLRIGRVVYATMKGTDLALAEITEAEPIPGVFRLAEKRDLDSDSEGLPAPVTMARMRELGIKALSLAAKIPEFGAPIRVISAHEDTLREHNCHHEGLADVLESIWHWYGLARNDCEDVQPGSSGAPVFNAQNEFFAIINTSSKSSLSQDCYTGQPCELTEQNFQVALGRNYGSVVTGLGSCFNTAGWFQTGLQGCPLQPSASLLLTAQVKTPLNPALRKDEERIWDIHIENDNPVSKGFRYKPGRMPLLDCRSQELYSECLDWSDQTLQKLRLPEQSGLFGLCVVSEEEFQSHDLRYPVLAVLNVDDHPPTLKPRLIMNPQTQEPLIAIRKSCQNLPAGSTLDLRKKCAVAVVTLEAQPFEIVDFAHGYLDAKDRDCTRIKGPGQGPQAHIPVAALPANLCVWAIDGAGNRSEEPDLYAIRAATRREIIEATDVMVDWSLLEGNNCGSLCSQSGFPPM